MTLQEALHQDRNILSEIDLSGLDGSARLAFARAHRSVKERCAEGRKAAQRIRREHAQTGEDGEVLTNDEGIPLVEDEAAHNDALADLMGSEVEVKKVPEEHWQGLTNDQVAILEPILEANE